MKVIEKKIEAAEAKVVKLTDSLKAFTEKNSAKNPELVKKRKSLTDKKTSEIADQIKELNEQLAVKQTQAAEVSQTKDPVKVSPEEKAKDKAPETPVKKKDTPVNDIEPAVEKRGRGKKYTEAADIIELIKTEKVRNLSHLNEKFYGAYAAMVKNNWKQEIVDAKVFVPVVKEVKK